MNPMLEAFISEARDLIEAASSCFLALEDRPGDAELLNDLFRSIHTIKGGAGLFKIEPFIRVVHRAEDALDRIRDGELDLTPERTDIFLEILDQISTWLDELEATEELGPDAEERSAALVAQIEAMTATGPASPPPPAQKEQEQGPVPEAGEQPAAEEQPLDSSPPPPWLARAVDACFAANRPEILARSPLVAITYTPDEQCFFTGDDPLLTVRNTPDLLWFTVEGPDSWGDVTEFDPYQCRVRFHCLAGADEPTLREHFQYVEEQVEFQEVSRAALLQPSGAPAASATADAFVADARTAIANSDWDQLASLSRAALETAGPELFTASALRRILLLLAAQVHEASLFSMLVEAVAKQAWPVGESVSAQPEDSPPSSADQNARKDLPAGDDRTLALDILHTQDRILEMPCAPELWQGRLRAVATTIQRTLESLGEEGQAAKLEEAVAEAIARHDATPVRRILGSALKGKEATVPLAAPTAPPSPATPPEKRPPDLGQTRKERRPTVIKVDHARIDALMDLAGELVVAKNGLPFLARKAEEEFGLRELAREIKQHYAVLNRIVDELQHTVMQVSMVPVSTVFGRFPRLVRDLSRKLGKEIRLLIEGEETEADKNVIESLSEPLIHMVRNSIDHGIEPPEVREENGKERCGVIRISARQTGDQVVIEVQDDGRGIDPEVIKKKAYEKGVISEEQLDTITDAEAVRLILAPGLSTAEQVSDLSGRGVGMDVVRNAVEQAGGTLDIESSLGRGTTVRLSMPLSMAVTQVMLVEVGGQSFGVPMDAIRETVRVPAKEIRRIKGQEVVVLRQRLIPICRLRQVLGLNDEHAKARETEAIMVVSVAGQEIGLVVDGFDEGVDIILKPPEGIMAKFRLYAGTALLGDGRVLLIFDLKELIRCL